MKEITISKGTGNETSVKRPFILTLLCLFSFVFFGLMTIVFLFALFYSGSITDMVLRYSPENPSAGITVGVYIVGGFILHAIAFSGIILIWRLKKIGYWLFGIASLIIASYQLFATQISPLTTALDVILLIAIGIFYKRLA
jgi:hypothetical protein